MLTGHATEDAGTYITVCMQGLQEHPDHATITVQTL